MLPSKSSLHENSKELLFFVNKSIKLPYTVLKIFGNAFRCLGDFVGLFERYIQHSLYPVFVLLHFFADAAVVP